MRQRLLALALALLVGSVASNAPAADGDVAVRCEADVGMSDAHHFSGTFRIPASKDDITWVTQGPNDFLEGFVASPNEYGFTVHAQIGDSTYDLHMSINRQTLDFRIDRLESSMSRNDIPVFDPRNKVVLRSTGDYALGRCRRVALGEGI